MNAMKAEFGRERGTNGKGIIKLSRSAITRSGQVWQRAEVLGVSHFPAACRPGASTAGVSDISNHLRDRRINFISQKIFDHLPGSLTTQTNNTNNTETRKQTPTNVTEPSQATNTRQTDTEKANRRTPPKKAMSGRKERRDPPGTGQPGDTGSLPCS